VSQPPSVQNQLNGFCNDAAGNLVLNTSCPQPPFTPSYYYDAENRLIATAGYSYIYDGNGQRVEKCTEGTTPGTCATNATGTLYWRGLSSDALSETNLAGTVQNNYVFFNGQRVARSDSTPLIHYYFSDHLGSHGVVENANGATCEQDIDYYPYGGAENDYCATVAQNYKFTGKERDTESGLDNFGKRYNASSMGRFMTPDPVGIMKQKLLDPQQWNMYAYVRNNPLRFVDPTGMYLAGCGSGVKNCDKQIQNLDKSLQNALKSKDPNIVKAAQAYGKLGDANGVNVSLVKVVDPDHPNVTGKTTDLGKTGGYTVDPATGKVQQATQVDIRAGMGGSQLEETAVHEGVHVEDRANFVNSITTPTTFDRSLNITGRQSERNAYGVENEWRDLHGMPALDINNILAHPPYSDNPNIDKPLFPNIEGPE
jgi:RHS repeat-associated protein